MNKFVSVAAVAVALIGGPALAKDMHCHVNQDYKAALDGKETKANGTTYKIKVKDTFKGKVDSVSTKDYNKYVNIKFGEEKSNDKNTNVQVRPRTSAECLNGIYDDNKKQLWGGAYCDTSNHKQGKGLTMRALDGTNNTVYRAAGAATTTTKQNQFFALYAKQGSDYVLIGACVEDR